MVQPNYLPWRGYLDLISSVDLFVFYDDVPLGTGKKWRNRNCIRTQYGTRWLTVPIRHGQGQELLYNVEIAPLQKWQCRHVRQVRAAYARTAFPDYVDKLETILQTRFSSLVDLDIALCRWLMAELGITTETRRARDIGYERDNKWLRPLGMLELLGATEYVMGPTAVKYTNTQEFARRGIRLEVKSYDYAPYEQLWPGFQGRVTVLDLLLSQGHDAWRHLASRSPNVVLVN